MKFAFIIDKAQTLPIVLKLIKESIDRKHKCSLFCCLKKEELGSVVSYLGNERISKIDWIYHQDRNYLVRKLHDTRKDYQAVLGINFFNDSS